MEKYFEIKPDCSLYKDYFAHEYDFPKIMDAFHKVCETFGIETDRFYLYKDCFCIVPAENDREKFDGVLKKTNYGEFKKNSEPCKMWCELVKHIEHFEKPRLFYYFNFLGYRWKERLFHVGEKLYCSIEVDKEIETPDFAVEIKASEFYKIIEDFQ